MRGWALVSGGGVPEVLRCSWPRTMSNTLLRTANAHLGAKLRAIAPRGEPLLSRYMHGISVGAWVVLWPTASMLNVRGECTPPSRATSAVDPSRNAQGRCSSCRGWGAAWTNGRKSVAADSCCLIRGLPSGIAFGNGPRFSALFVELGLCQAVAKLPLRYLQLQQHCENSIVKSPRYTVVSRCVRSRSPLQGSPLAPCASNTPRNTTETAAPAVPVAAALNTKHHLPSQTLQS